MVGSLEHVWNKRGTSLEQLTLILRELQGFVERAWNIGGTWGGLFIFFACSRKHERWKNVNAGNKNQLVGLFFLKIVNW